VRAGPFAEPADPAGYGPREASEEVVKALQLALRGGVPGAAIIAPPGYGKTLLLRVIADHLGARRCLYLPYAALELHELCAWTLGLLDRASASDPAAALASLVMAARGELQAGLVLMIDDANSMPIDTARELGRFVRQSGGGLQVLIAAADDARTSRVIAALGLDVAIARYMVPFSEAETQAYVTARLDRAHVPRTIRARFEAQNITRIHSLSGGVPRRIHTLAAELAREEITESHLIEIENEVRALGSLPSKFPDLDQVADWETDLG
jgi:type II secretory pathway predicted ATPase ExeA